MIKDLVNEFENSHIVAGAKDPIDEISEYKNGVKQHSLFEEFNTDYLNNTIIMGYVLEHIENQIKLCSRIYNW